jgi:hypothetical protein
MKLQARFIQLPLQFDAELLATEVASVSQDAWMAHPAGFAGNDFLPLISAHGDPKHEGIQGPMRPTPHLNAQRPYLMQTLASIGATLGRTRLMRLSGQAEVSQHVDINYYWRDRMRVHVPIVTQPTVRFDCGGESVHMAAGECWVFDTWSMHRVINDAERARIHLVIDTVGGEGLLKLLSAGKATGMAAPPNWRPQAVTPGASAGPLDFENLNVPMVMSPWELREHLNFLLGEVAPGQPAVADIARAASPFLHRWRALWAAFGEAEAGWPRYRALLDEFTREVAALGAGGVRLRNGQDLLTTLNVLVFIAALSDKPRFTGAGEWSQAQARAPGHAGS